MTNPLWTLGEPSGSDYLTALFDAIGNGAYPGGATPTTFSLTHDNNEVVFDGNFTLDVGDGHVAGGTITGFHVYQDGNLLLDASGYQAGIDDFNAALDALNANDLGPLYDLIYAGPMTVEGTAGTDQIFGGKFDDHLSGRGGWDILYGEGGNDIIVGGSGRDYLDGGRGKDLLKGGAGGDKLLGDDGKDVLKGGAGGDLLAGGEGNDVMTGNAGSDTFLFNFAPGAGGVDKITDFDVGHDTIALLKEAFDQIGPAGDLGVAKFYIGAHAHDKSDRVIYDDKTGALYYDADGKGGATQIEFAHLDAGLNLSTSDFEVAGAIVIG